MFTCQVSGLALSCAVATMHPRFRRPSFRPYRALVYASLGLSAIVFVLHGIVLYGWSVQNQRMSLDWMILMACLNLGGGGIYAARVSTDSPQMSVVLILDRFLRSGAQGRLISSEVVTRFFTSWLYSPV